MRQLGRRDLQFLDTSDPLWVMEPRLELESIRPQHLSGLHCTLLFPKVPGS